MAFFVFCCIGIAYIEFLCTIAVVTTLSMTKTKWEEIINKCELPATRMLLSQQAELQCIALNEVVIALSPNWENMIKSRKAIIEKAVREVFGDDMKTTFIVKEK